MPQNDLVIELFQPLADALTEQAKLSQHCKGACVGAFCVLDLGVTDADFNIGISDKQVLLSLTTEEVWEAWITSALDVNKWGVPKKDRLPNKLNVEVLI